MGRHRPVWGQGLRAQLWSIWHPVASTNGASHARHLCTKAVTVGTPQEHPHPHAPDWGVSKTSSLALPLRSHEAHNAHFCLTQ